MKLRKGISTCIAQVAMEFVAIDRKGRRLYRYRKENCALKISINGK